MLRLLPWNVQIFFKAGSRQAALQCVIYNNSQILILQSKKSSLHTKESKAVHKVTVDHP